MSKTLLLAYTALAALLHVSTANAQETPDLAIVGPDRGRNESVNDRSRELYESDGLQIGAFTLRPSLGLETVFDDNVFYQGTGGQDDIVFVSRPRLGVETNWSTHALRLAVGLDDFRFSDLDSEHHTDVFVEGEGRLDVRRGTSIVLGGRQSREAESRGSPDSPGAAAKPTRYEVRQAYVAGVHEFNRARVSLRLEREGYNYKDAPLVLGGVIDQDARDFVETVLTGRIEYAISPDTAIVGQASGNQREYDLSPPNPFAPVNRDSEGSSFLIGLNTDISNLVRGEIVVGHLQQNYKDPSLKSPNDIGIQAQIEYFATPLTTLTFGANRSVAETLVASSSSFVSTQLDARVDHELRRNVLLSAGVKSEKRAFEGTNRNDDMLFADAGARFLLNRRAELGARWRFERQDTSGAITAQDYEVNRFVLSAVVRF